MKAQELRIGNLLKDIDGNIVEVITVYGIGNYVVHSSIHQFAIIEKDDDLIIPIPLTEEWLLRFGFKRHHSDYSNGVIYIKDVPNSLIFRWGVYPFELGSGFQINMGKPLECVHQLQNLYFALTGEELIYN